MNDQPRHLGHARLERLAAWLGRPLRHFHRDESGATLTEFVIMLPFFILIFQGVMTLGKLNERGTHPPIEAYKETFSKALEYQKSYYKVGTAWQTTAAGIDSEYQLASVSQPHNDSGVVEVASGVWDAADQAALGLEGTMGESYVRSWAVGQVADLNAFHKGQVIDLNGQGNDKILTHDIKDIIGKSEFARQLFDDGVNVNDFKNMGGGGAFGALSSVLSGTGLRPSIAAGIRYGTVSAKVSHNISYPGGNMETNAWFVTAIPPGTTGRPREDAIRATAISRITMEGLKPYKDLLGIKYKQPLKHKKITVPDYP